MLLLSCYRISLRQTT